MYITHLLSQCLYCNACIILLVVGSIAFWKEDLRRTELKKNVAAPPETCKEMTKQALGRHSMSNDLVFTFELQILACMHLILLLFVF